MVRDFTKSIAQGKYIIFFLLGSALRLREVQLIFCYVSIMKIKYVVK